MRKNFIIDPDPTGCPLVHPASVTITTSYHKGRATLERTGKQWPATLIVMLQTKPGTSATAKSLGMANGQSAFRTMLDGTNQVTSGSMEGGLDLGAEWGQKLAINPPSPSPFAVKDSIPGDLEEFNAKGTGDLDQNPR